MVRCDSSCCAAYVTSTVASHADPATSVAVTYGAGAAGVALLVACVRRSAHRTPLYAAGFPRHSLCPTTSTHPGGAVTRTVASALPGGTRPTSTVAHTAPNHIFRSLFPFAALFLEPLNGHSTLRPRAPRAP